jgi:hypothetical protein
MPFFLFGIGLLFSFCSYLCGETFNFLFYQLKICIDYEEIFYFVCYGGFCR